MVIQFGARFLLGVPDLNVHVPNDDYQEEDPTSSPQLLEIAEVPVDQVGNVVPDSVPHDCDPVVPNDER